MEGEPSLSPSQSVLAYRPRPGYLSVSAADPFLRVAKTTRPVFSKMLSAGCPGFMWNTYGNRDVLFYLDCPELTPAAAHGWRSNSAPRILEMADFSRNPSAIRRSTSQRARREGGRRVEEAAPPASPVQPSAVPRRRKHDPEARTQCALICAGVSAVHGFGAITETLASISVETGGDTRMLRVWSSGDAPMVALCSGWRLEVFALRKNEPCCLRRIWQTQDDLSGEDPQIRGVWYDSCTLYVLTPLEVRAYPLNLTESLEGEASSAIGACPLTVRGLTRSLDKFTALSPVGFLSGARGRPALVWVLGQIAPRGRSFESHNKYRAKIRTVDSQVAVVILTADASAAVFELVVPVSAKLQGHHASSSGIVLSFSNAMCVGVEFSRLRPCAALDLPRQVQPALWPLGLSSAGAEDGLLAAELLEEPLRVAWASVYRGANRALIPCDLSIGSCFEVGVSRWGRLSLSLVRTMSGKREGL